MWTEWRFVALVGLGTIGMLIGPSTAKSQSLEDSVVEYVTPYVDAGDFAGVVLLAGPDGIRYEATHGRAERLPTPPRSRSTRFRIGSVSKQVTAAAVLRLAEDGHLDLQEPVGKWFPDVPVLQDITAHQLLTHTAGVADIYELTVYPEIAASGVDGVEEVVRHLAEEPLRYEPGTDYAYSNGGYIILARLVELASSQPFADFLAESVLGPLGLADTGSEPIDGPVPGQATPYDPAGRDAVAPASAVNLTVLQGAGSLYSSARDLYAWLRAMYEGALLAPESWKAMTTDYGNGYGYGISVYSRDGRPVAGHDGRVAGGISDVSLFLDDGSAIVVVGNVQTGVADEFRRDLYRLLFGSVATPRLRESVDEPRLDGDAAWRPSPTELAAWAGAYRFHPGLVVHASVREGRLFVRANSGGESELVAMEPGTFFSRMLYANVGFEGEGDQRRMIWREAGNRWIGTVEPPD